MLANHQLPVNNLIYLMNMVFYTMISATFNHKLKCIWNDEYSEKVISL